MHTVSNPHRNRLTAISRTKPLHLETRVDASGNTFRTIRAYNNTGGALTAGRPYILTPTGVVSINPTVAVVATSGTTLTNYVVFATAATANASWDDFVFDGYYSILVNGTTDVAVSDYLKLAVATTTALIKDGAAQTNNSCAQACAASTANSDNSTYCFIFGDRCAIAQS